MPLSILFWVLYLLALVLSVWGIYEPGQPPAFRAWGGSLLIFILVGLLGWQVFGAAVR